jgi:hypothetical protein
MSMIERVLHRIEDHVEEWRKQEGVRKAEAAAQRERLWAEAAEREKLLAEAIASEESRRASLGEITRQHRVVFVVHSEEMAQTLESFADEGGSSGARDPWQRQLRGRRGHQRLVASVRDAGIEVTSSSGEGRYRAWARTLR